MAAAQELLSLALENPYSGALISVPMMSSEKIVKGKQKTEIERQRLSRFDEPALFGTSAVFFLF